MHRERHRDKLTQIQTILSHFVLAVSVYIKKYNSTVNSLGV